MSDDGIGTGEAGGDAPGRARLLDAYAIADRSAPRIRMNFVSSLDGAVTIDGRSGGLGDEADRLAMRVLRTLADVVVVGAGTVRAEGYGGIRVDDEDAEWRIARGMPPQPRLAIVSSALDLDPGHPVFAKAVVRPIVATQAGSARARRDALAEVAEVLICGDEEVDLRATRDALAAAGLRQVLCEGGPHLFGTLLSAGLVDELCLSLSPTLVGGGAGRIVQGAPEADRRMRLLHAIPAGDLLLLRYARD
ncbi:pyrimidine reductase family protein [Agromyces sp. LHK192]|uniref:pyrimidine reductase family protein n=1 Tax=Agromyces sp. LHK192 TaxID=2498704 RepID=UPI0013E3F193|nr:pyrimidine reductase family protein [Agromyces sp. LHK192]